MHAPAPTGYADREPTHAPPWHGLVVWDVFFNALTTGLFLTAAAGELVRPALFAPVAAWAYALAMALLLIDLALLVLDLGDPLRFHHMLRAFKPSSPMSLGTWCLTFYSLPLAAVVAVEALELLGANPVGAAGSAAVRHVLLVAALPFAFGSMAYKGVLFSTSSQPGWRDARWLGAYHVGSALALGSALLLGLAVLRGVPDLRPMRAAVAVLLVAQFVPLALLASELRPALAARVARGRLALATALALGVGIAVPLPLLALRGFPLICAIAAALTGGWAVRHLVVTLPHREPHATTRRPLAPP